MAVATTHARASTAAPGVLILSSSSSSGGGGGRGDEPRCSNPECDSHRADRVFHCVDPGDGDTCTTCGTKQSSGGSLHHALANQKGHREQTDDERREVDAAKTFSEQMREGGGGLVDLEARCRGHERSRETESLQLAHKTLKNSASAKLAHLHPRALNVPTKSDLEQQKKQIADHRSRLAALLAANAPALVVCHAAAAAVESVVGMAAGEAFGSSMRDALAGRHPTAAAAADQGEGEDEYESKSEAPPAAKYQRVDASALPLSASSIVEEFESQMAIFTTKQARASQHAQTEFRKAMSHQLMQERVDYTTADGTQLTLTEQDVRNARAQIMQREMFGSAAAASAASAASAAAVSSPAAAAAAAAAASVSSVPVAATDLSDALRRNKMARELHPRVDELFSWVYVNCILSDWTAPRAVDPRISRDYRVHGAQVDLFNRTLKYVTEFKGLLSVKMRKQMRNVELHAMHALIIASWESETPLCWSVMHTALETYLVSRSENVWQEQRDKAMQRYQKELLKAARDPSSSHQVPKAPDIGVPLRPKSLGRASSLDRTLYDVASALNVKGDWAALVRRFARRYLIQLNQRVYEQDVNNEVDKCVAVFHKHLRGVEDRNELRFQIGVSAPASSASSSSSPSASSSSSSSSSSSAAAAASAPASSSSSPSASGDAGAAEASPPRLMWQFSSAVAAAACVRKVVGSKHLALDENTEEHCNVKLYKEEWAKKRQRPSVTKGGQPSMQIKAARFAALAGDPGRNVSACMKLF